MYITTRISEYILQSLRDAGVNIDNLPDDTEYSLRDLAAYVHGKGRFTGSKKDLMTFLVNSRSEAFDNKYANYSYESDARKIEERWKKEFVGILKRFKVYDYRKRHIINVGIGNGLEGVGLFEGCTNFTGVDIAPDSIRSAQSRFPRAKFYVDSAEELSEIAESSQDIYVSLRTYQSAFFDISEAVRKAYSVLAPGGIALISIANAYMDESSFVRGLLPHGSNSVD